MSTASPPSSPPRTHWARKHTHKSTPSLSLLPLSVLVLLFPRWRLKGDAEQTEQPEAVEGLAAAAYLCTPTPPNPLKSICSSLECQRGKRVSRPEPQGQVAYSIWCTWGAVESCWSLTGPVTDNNHRELWSLISAAVWLRQNGAPKVKCRWITSGGRKAFKHGWQIHPDKVM